MPNHRTTNPRNAEEAKKFADVAQLASQLPIITEEQAAILLQISMPSLQRLRRLHNLPTICAGSRVIRYPRAELLEALKNIPR